MGNNGNDIGVVSNLHKRHPPQNWLKPEPEPVPSLRLEHHLAQCGPQCELSVGNTVCHPPTQCGPPTQTLVREWGQKRESEHQLLGSKIFETNCCLFADNSLLDNKGIRGKRWSHMQVVAPLECSWAVGQLGGEQHGRIHLTEVAYSSWRHLGWGWRGGEKVEGETDGALHACPTDDDFSY